MPKKPTYTKEILKKLVTFLESYKEYLQNNNKGEIWSDIENLTKFLKATYYEPMTFEDWIESQSNYAEVLLYPYEDTPLLVKGDNELRDIFVKFRLTEKY